MHQQSYNGRNGPRLLSKLHYPLAALGKNRRTRTALQSEFASTENVRSKTISTQEKGASFQSKSSSSLEVKQRGGSGEKVRNHNSVTSNDKDRNGEAKGIQMKETVLPKSEPSKIVRTKRLTSIRNTSVFTNEAKITSVKEETIVKKRPNSKPKKKTSLTKTAAVNNRGTGDIKSDDVESLCFNNKSAADAVTKPAPPTGRSSREQGRRSSGFFPLKASLFSNIPLYLNFTTSNEKMIKVPKEIRSTLQWKMSKVTPSLIARIVRRSGFRIIKEEDTWISTWGRHVGCKKYSEFKDNQKVNHFPGTFHLGRKDRLWMNILKMQELNGKRKFSFMPKTFILPQNMDELREAWLEAGRKTKWIIKPPASARGIGINVVHHWSDVPKSESVIVQKYISRPYLINETKFDLRLYILVTSFDPLRIYIYEDGLVRFASEKYSRSFKHLDEKYIHLTNYSINRCNSCYQSNEDETLRQGHKWTLKCLWSYFRENGVNDKKIWSSLIDVVVKTVISCEGPIVKLLKTYAKNRYSYYELFGFDIILDYKLKPWLLEVNISPSLHTNSQLDLKIKSELIKDMFNIAGFHIAEEIELDSASKLQICKLTGIDPQTQFHWNDNLYQLALTEEDMMKQAKYKDVRWSQASILRNLTPDDIRQLVQSEDELSRCGHFVRIFPTNSSSSYLDYLPDPKYYNLLLDAWEKRYYNTRATGIRYLRYLCKKRLHLPSIQQAANDDVQLEEITEESNVVTEKNDLSPTDKNEDEAKRVESSTSKAHGDGPTITQLQVPVNDNETPTSELQTPNNATTSLG